MEKLEKKKAEIRKILIEQGSFSMGEFSVVIDQRKRLCPISVIEIKAILGEKADDVLQIQKFKTVKVSRK